MKIQYFKLLNLISKKPCIMAKLINNDTVLTVSKDDIESTEEVTDTYGSRNYFEKNGYVESTKQEFDEFFIKTVGKINELSKL